jgi:hypothetical protein
VHRDPPDWVELPPRVGVHHVAANLDDEHPAVAVKRNCGRLLNDGVREHELEAVPRLKDEFLELLFGRQRQERGALREVIVRVGRIVELWATLKDFRASPAAAAASALFGRRPGLGRRRRRTGRRGLGGNYPAGCQNHDAAREYPSTTSKPT